MCNVGKWGEQDEDVTAKELCNGGVKVSADIELIGITSYGRIVSNLPAEVASRGFL